MLSHQGHPDDGIAGILSLDVIGAQNLPSSNRLPNPFVVISYGRRAYRTRWHRSTTSPSWGESLQLVVKWGELEKYLIVLSVYDYDRMGYNQCLGTTNVKVQFFGDQPEEQCRLALQLQNDADGQESLLLLKGQFRTIASLETEFWEGIVAECADSGSVEVERLAGFVGFDTLEVSELKCKLLESLTACPFCRQPVHDAAGYEHLILCNHKQQAKHKRQTRGNFVTEEYASRKWFSRILEMLGFGGYRVGHNGGHILVHDRRTGRTLEERIPLSIKLAIRWMHVNTVNRQAIDWPVIRSLLQRLTVRQGVNYDGVGSAKYIADFVKYHKLNMDEVEVCLDQFRTFNEFFYRRLKSGARPIECPHDDTVMVSPADCRLHCYKSVSDATKFWIKGRHFTIPALLSQDTISWSEEACLLIARLAPQDYHRFHSPVSGKITAIRHIPGAYFTVNPMAVRQNIDIFTENTRTIVLIESPEFGHVAFVAVGAMMVGSIVLTVCGVGREVRRGEEIGYFAFGGSTIVVVCDRVAFDQDILAHSKTPIETLVRVGERVGHARLKN